MLQQKCESTEEAPVRAELFGSNRCTAEGLVACTPSPVLAMCRMLLAAGIDGRRRLDAYRGATLCLTVSSIAYGASLVVDGASRFARWKPLFRSEGTAPIDESDDPAGGAAGHAE